MPLEPAVLQRLSAKRMWTNDFHCRFGNPRKITAGWFSSPAGLRAPCRRRQLAEAAREAGLHPLASGGWPSAARHWLACRRRLIRKPMALIRALLRRSATRRTCCRRPDRLQHWPHSRPAMAPDTAEAFPLPVDMPTAAGKVGLCAPSKLPSPVSDDPEARLWRVPGIPGTEPA